MLAPDAFHDQFLLARDPISALAGWREAGCRGWRLLSHPSLPVHPLATSDGNAAGFAIGHLIGADGRMPRGPLTLPPLPPEEATRTACIESFIYAFGGRFLFLLMLPSLERVYLDPLGSRAAVFCPQRRRVASTASILLYDEPGHPLFRRTERDFPSNAPNLFYPADLTSADGVRRIGVNHTLDLAFFTSSRHHLLNVPKDATPEEIPGIVGRIHELIQRNIGAVVDDAGGAYLWITSGEDSRRLLACARPFIDRLEGITVQRNEPEPGSLNAADCAAAPVIARLAGLRHRLMTNAPLSPRRKRDYLLRTGFAGGAGKASRFYHPGLALDSTRASITGHPGGIDRVFPTLHDAFLARQTLRNLATVIHMHDIPGIGNRWRVRRALARWLDGLPPAPAAFIVEAASLEHRMGAWVAPHLYGFPPFRSVTLPVCHREIIDGMMRLPYAYRAAGGPTRDLLARAWPELLSVPFNLEPQPRAP